MEDEDYNAIDDSEDLTQPDDLDDEDESLGLEVDFRCNNCDKNFVGYSGFIIFAHIAVQLMMLGGLGR